MHGSASSIVLCLRSCPSAYCCIASVTRLRACRCHYDQLDTGQPSKAVSLANAENGDIKLTVLVAPRRLKHMRKIYAGLDRVAVLPLSMRSADISPALLSTLR